MISRLNSNGFITIEIRIQTTGINSALAREASMQTCWETQCRGVLQIWAGLLRSVGFFILVNPIFPALLPFSNEAAFRSNRVEIHGFKIQ